MLSDPSDITALAALSHFNGIIHESMRLVPAALAGPTRITPSEGMNFEGTFIPAGVKIAAPPWTIFRCAYETSFPARGVPLNY